MDEVIINNWNKYIKKNDIVWHLGDFAWRNAAHYARSVNGRINLILGNHDYKKLNIKDRNIFNSIQDIHEFKCNNISITLSHFAMRVWNKSHFNSYHLYGHSHGTLPGQGKSFDCGVDTNNYKPYSLYDILSKMESLPNNPNYIKHLQG